MKPSLSLAVLFIMSGAAHAEPQQTGLAAAVPQPSAETTGQLDYSAYVAGFNMLKIRAGIGIGASRYDLGLHLETSGTIGAFVHGDTVTRVSGIFGGLAPLPRNFLSTGVWRGEQRRIEIDYPQGQPVIKTLIPSDTDDPREPVPPGLQRNTIDSLSAVVALIHAVATTGGCNTNGTTFDGHRLASVKAHTVGMEMLPPESRSSYAGPALHCQIDGQQLAGFPRDAKPDDYVHLPQVADAWFATIVPGMAPVPVMMSFPTRLMGHMTVYVTQAKPGVNFAEFTPGK